MTKPKSLTVAGAKESILRGSLLAFVYFAFSTLKPDASLRLGKHHAVFADAFERAALGMTTRAIVNAPPRTLKSFICVVAGACWAVGRQPDIKVMVIAGNRGLASDLFDQVLTLLTSSRYRALFPGVRVTADGMTIRTNAGGSITFSGFRQTQIGRGADLILCDDPISPTDAQDEKKRKADGIRFRSEILPRFNDPERGSLILVSQRLHRDDLTGQIQALPGPCHTVSMPAIATRDEDWILRNGQVLTRVKGEFIDDDRLSRSALRSLLLSMSGYRFKPQYQQDTTVPFNSFEENRTGAMYYPKGHPFYREDILGPAWFFSSGVPETEYVYHELFGGIEPPRPWDGSLDATPEEWERAAMTQQRLLIQSQAEGKRPPTAREVRDEVARMEGQSRD